MATLEDFENALMDLVHDYAGDDHLEEFGSVARAMVLKAAQQEQERIARVLSASIEKGGIPFALVTWDEENNRAGRHALDVDEILEALKP